VIHSAQPNLTKSRLYATVLAITWRQLKAGKTHA